MVRRRRQVNNNGFVASDYMGKQGIYLSVGLNDIGYNDEREYVQWIELYQFPGGN
jgi:hypothetical protein